MVISLWASGRLVLNVSASDRSFVESFFVQIIGVNIAKMTLSRQSYEGVRVFNLHVVKYG